MSLLDNIKGIRGDGDETGGGGTFNPFKLLEIGEMMMRYCDGIRIKDFVFLAILTSERLVLIDSAKQGSGVIAKEIPVSVIKHADLERDERGRPTLAINMEIGEQNRVMRLVFSGLMNDPDSECREWFTAINGYPPAASPSPEPPEIAPIIEAPESVPELPEEPHPDPGQINPTPSIPEPRPQPQPESSFSQGEDPGTVPPSRPVIVSKIQMERPVRQRPPLEGTPREGTIRIMIERPAFSPLRIRPSTTGPDGSTAPSRFCIHCGGRISSSGKFCPICGKNQM